MKKIEEIRDNNNQILAIVIKETSNDKELLFITPEDFPLQVGLHNRKKNSFIRPHTHIPIFELKNISAQEVFHVQKGKVKVTIYDNHDQPHSSFVIEKGESALLVSGHSMEFLEDTEMIEFKQGPYRGTEKEKKYILPK